MAEAKKDSPWLMRTYAGHSTAEDSNRLFRTNLSKGQTGLSVAFDLPTQTGYDSDDPRAAGEVGKVGVPVSHIGDMRTLFADIPLAEMNTSMTINATAAWLMALYVAVAEEQGAPRAKLQGTTQNDIIKEYLARGTYVFPPDASLRLTVDTIAFATQEMPKFNPVNICSYHLQEAGATPAQELAFALATATAVLDACKASPDIAAAAFPVVASRISFFVNAGIRFITELSKMRAFVDLWDELLRERYGVADEKLRRFRYGVQVNSLGLTEPQPENNVYRILIEMLGVVLSKKARARAVQLPAWNEALGLPRPFDQQWSLRMQQIMAFETDLLEHEDIFDGSSVIAAKVEALKLAAKAEMARVATLGGAASLAGLSYMKEALVSSNTARLQAIESGDTKVVGVNVFTTSEPSPLAAGNAIMTVKDDVEFGQIERLKAWRAKRDGKAVAAALAGLKSAAAEGRNVMEPSIACARAGVTTGEWGAALRQVFGEFRAPTGVTLHHGDAVHASLEDLRTRVGKLAEVLGTQPKFLMGKPGLDGHSNGAEQIATRAADIGLSVIYDGIRMTPDELVERAANEQVHLLGLSILSGSHVPLVREVMQKLRARNISIPVVVGGIIPEDDSLVLKQLGVSAVYTPKDYDLNRIMDGLVGLVERGGAASQVPSGH
jgi:(2R)-ethylmalonyl-CoA mutase